MQLLCGRLDRMEISAATFMEQCTRMIAAAIGCSRAGIWLFDDAFDGRRLRCLCLYDTGSDRTTVLPDETNDEVGPYFAALEESGFIVANDASTHPATAGLFRRRLCASGVRSLMAASFSVNGQLFGAFTCTQTGSPAAWTSIQLSMLLRLGGRASLALARATATEFPTRPAPL